MITYRKQIINWNCLVVFSALLLLISCKEKRTATESIAQTVDLIKAGIQKKGLVSREEANGLNLLSRMVSGNNLDNDLIQNVHTYMDSPNPSDLSRNIISLFDLVQTQGNISDVDQKALDDLVRLTSLDNRGQ